MLSFQVSMVKLSMISSRVIPMLCSRLTSPPEAFQLENNWIMNRSRFTTLLSKLKTGVFIPNRLLLVWKSYFWMSMITHQLLMKLCLRRFWRKILHRVLLLLKWLPMIWIHRKMLTSLTVRFFCFCVLAMRFDEIRYDFFCWIIILFFSLFSKILFDLSFYLWFTPYILSKLWISSKAISAN